MGIMKLKRLFDKFNIKTDEEFPKTIFNIEIDNEAKQFIKGYKSNGQIIFLGEYKQKDGEYNRLYNIKITVELPEDIDYELLNKLEEFNQKNNKNIWENNEEALNALKLLDFESVKYYVSSEELPTVYVAYNLLGGINRHS